jgi:hypothetical protein
VSTALSEEIHGLSELVDKFKMPFQSEQHVLKVYKKELYYHVQNGLVGNLRARLSAELAMNIENIQQEITGNK